MIEELKSIKFCYQCSKIKKYHDIRTQIGFFFRKWLQPHHHGATYLLHIVSGVYLPYRIRFDKKNWKVRNIHFEI